MSYCCVSILQRLQYKNHTFGNQRSCNLWWRSCWCKHYMVQAQKKQWWKNFDHSWHVQRVFISSCGFQEQLMGCLLLGCQFFGIRMWHLARTGIWNGCRISTISLSKQMGFGPRVFVNFDQFWQISTAPFVHLGQRAQFELCSIHCHLGQWRAQDAGHKTYKLDLEFARWQ